MKVNDSLNIILPVYNERDTLVQVLDEWIKELSKLKINFTFIICEDGSTDGTKQLLLHIKKKYHLVLYMKNERLGYGGAILAGIKIAHSKYIMFVDSDGQFDPKDFINLWSNREKADVIKGWRVKRID